jgi:hypothetical protein
MMPGEDQPTPQSKSITTQSKENGLNGIYCTGGKVTIDDNQLRRNHIITSTGGGQIDVGNAFTTNTNAVITATPFLMEKALKPVVWSWPEESSV